MRRPVWIPIVVAATLLASSVVRAELETGVQAAKTVRQRGAEFLRIFGRMANTGRVKARFERGMKLALQGHGFGYDCAKAQSQASASPSRQVGRSSYTRFGETGWVALNVDPRTGHGSLTVVEQHPTEVMRSTLRVRKDGVRSHFELFAGPAGYRARRTTATRVRSRALPLLSRERWRAARSLKGLPRVLRRELLSGREVELRETVQRTSASRGRGTSSFAAVVGASGCTVPLTSDQWQQVLR